MENKYGSIIARASELTDEAFRDKIAGLTRLNSEELEDVMLATGIDKESLAEILAIIENAWLYNEEEAAAIQKFTKGISVLIALVKKII